MDRPCDTQAGMKHRCTASALRYLRSEVMEMCQRENSLDAMQRERCRPRNQCVSISKGRIQTTCDK
jgi:hypothetical protein